MEYKPTMNTGFSTVQYGYKFNFISGQWSNFNTPFNVADFKFDNIGNMYLLDTQGNVYNN